MVPISLIIHSTNKPSLHPLVFWIIFFVISVTFDANKADVFERVEIYDSPDRVEMSRLSTRSGVRIPTTTRVARYLMRVQQFLNEFAFYDIESVYSQLKKDSKIILRKATYNSCPQQLNGYDCSFVSFAAFFHIAQGVNIDETIFIQENVTEV
jgi:hypothetical protein